MEVLVCLASWPGGEPVSKDTILKTVWAGTFVTEDVLTRSISELRRVFEDNARQPRFIQTIPRRGYRLVAPLEPANGNGPRTTLATRRPMKVKLFAVAGALVLLVIFSGSVLRSWRARATPAETSHADVEPSIEHVQLDLTKDRDVRLATNAGKKWRQRIVKRDPDLKKSTETATTVQDGPKVSRNEDAGTSHVTVESTPPRIESLFQNIPPDVVRTRVRHAVLPAYPAFAIQAHVTGTVEIGLAVSPNGDVYSARVLVGHPMLVNSALEAMRQWRFEPNRVEGELTWSRMRALVRFRVDGTTAVAFAPPMLADSFGDLGSQRDELREATTLPIVPEVR